MTDTHKIHDPFLNKEVEISSRLVDRLRGKYANGPTLPNGEPEFGWRQFDTPPIQHEAADEIEWLREALRAVVRDINEYERTNNLAPNPGRTECWDSVSHAKAVLGVVSSPPTGGK